ncbi:hypothetical protein DKT77_13040 [Meridianimarinicoccus roseus]|uniref:Flagellar motor switch protein FliN-like C-terminal domain-containing protein n=1 Tax=Meridianimarinicoccus roseus TaxID=2072018 RepID=A0A2V2L9Q7_9RHOB|nr:FliM/FliN family flagellar motor C-terminal domain-containing protein [Meridianimarinicoccus roseus]PWR02188.1 hypothetical protein DKT77_13040 [Meridianimarinicoccus roseus]
MDEPDTVLNDRSFEGGRHPFTRLPVEVRIVVGRARLKVEELLSLEKSSVLPLDKNLADPVELYVGDRLIARGVLEEIEGSTDGQLAVRILDVSDESASL